MYMSAEGAQAQSRRLEVIANNLANVNTVGFKPDVATFQARLAEAIQQGDAMHGDRSMNDVGGGISVFDVTTNYTAGNLQRTGNDLDLAIVGNGFFEVDAGNNETLLTKAGNFSIDSQNRIVNPAGMPVLDSGGGEIIIDPQLPWTISQSGELKQAGTSIPLSLVEPSSTNELIKVGSNMFQALGDTRQVDPRMREVRSGFLEMSGTVPTRQMMSMIETSRAFEANTQMIKNQDSMSGSLISRVLRA